jgi:hypothetical protein
MAKVYINNFSGGMAKDSREPSTTKCAYIENFDILNHPHKLVPMQSTTANETFYAGGTNYGIQRFLAAKFGSTVNVIGLGKTSTSKPELFVKRTSLGIIAEDWDTALTASGAATGSFDNRMWHVFQDYAYFLAGSRYVGRVGPLASGSSATLVDTYYDAGVYTNASDAMTHSKLGIMYFGVDNKVYKNENGTISLGITLPSKYKISVVSEYQNYIAIGCTSVNDTGEDSVVYLWDGQSTLEDLSEAIPWGNGQLEVLGNIDGSLVGISMTQFGTFDINVRIVVRQFSGGAPVIIKEIIGTSSTLGSGSGGYKYQQNTGNKIYFVLDIKINGTSRRCIGVVGKGEDGNWVLAGDISVNNTTDAPQILGFRKIGDYWWHAFYETHIYRTSTISFNFGVGTYESLVNPNMPLEDRHKHKILRAVSVGYEKISADGGTIVLYYRVDGETSWTTLFTETTVGKFYTEATAESDGTPLKEGREFEFKVVSTSVNITEISYRYDTITSQING